MLVAKTPWFAIGAMFLTRHVTYERTNRESLPFRCRDLRFVEKEAPIAYGGYSDYEGGSYKSRNGTQPIKPDPRPSYKNGPEDRMK